MRITTATPRVLGKWRPLCQTVGALTRWPENQSTLGTTFVSCSSHYFISYTLKLPATFSSFGGERLASVVIKSERQTKEQQGQWKRLAKTKIWQAYRTGKKSTMDLLLNSVAMLQSIYTLGRYVKDYVCWTFCHDNKTVHNKLKMGFGMHREKETSTTFYKTTNNRTICP